MWLIITFVSIALIAVVNYIDEYLTAKNPVKSEVLNASIHKQVGGLIIASTLAGFLACVVIWVFGDIVSTKSVVLFGSIAGIGSVIIYVSYFYLLSKFPVWQVIPLFQLSTIWLVIIELLQGEAIVALQLFGIILILFGVYVFDIGEIKWKIPTKLLLYMIPVTLSWSFSLLAVKEGIKISNVASVSFWEFLTVGIIGVILFLIAKPYREGFIYRTKTQRKLFIGSSFVNESLSLGSYFLGNMAIAIAPVVTFVSALYGIQGVFVVFLFLLFPFKKEKINAMQIASIFVIAFGVFFIEGFKVF